MMTSVTFILKFRLSPSIKIATTCIVIVLFICITQQVSSIEDNGKQGGNTRTQYWQYYNKFIKTYGNLGSYYCKFIKNREDIKNHFDCFEELRMLAVSIQGCEYKNPAILNGFSIDEIKKKVLEPARMISEGTPFGKDRRVLVFISFEATPQMTTAFVWNLATESFISHINSTYDRTFEFDIPFLTYYDSIILIQPNELSTDNVLDFFFSKLLKSLEPGACVDYLVIGHGTKEGTVLSNRIRGKQEEHQIDMRDFLPLERGGNTYAQDLKHLLELSIDNGYSPRIIGLGCSSDYLQNCINLILDEHYKYSVKVFGTPFTTNGMYCIGFNDNYLDVLVHVSRIVDDIGLLIKLTDSGWELKNRKECKFFTINKHTGTNMDIVNDYINHNIASGSLRKPSGVIMQYVIKIYTEE